VTFCWGKRGGGGGVCPLGRRGEGRRGNRNAESRKEGKRRSPFSKRWWLKISFSQEKRLSLQTGTYNKEDGDSATKRVLNPPQKERGENGGFYPSKQGERKLRGGLVNGTLGGKSEPPEGSEKIGPHRDFGSKRKNQNSPIPPNSRGRVTFH